MVTRFKRLFCILWPIHKTDVLKYCKTLKIDQILQTLQVKSGACEGHYPEAYVGGTGHMCFNQTCHAGPYFRLGRTPSRVTRFIIRTSDSSGGHQRDTRVSRGFRGMMSCQNAVLYLSPSERDSRISRVFRIYHGGHYTDQCLPLMGGTDSVVVPCPVVNELDSVDFGI